MMVRDGVRASFPAENAEKARLLKWVPVDEPSPAAESEKAGGAMDAVEAFGTGAAKFLTGGLTDAAAGVGAGAASGIEALTQGKGIGGAAEDAMSGYREGRGERRAYEEEQYQESPLAYGAGGAVGSLTSAPLMAGKSLATTAGKGAVGGAAQGAALSEEDDLFGDFLNAMVGGGVGALAPVAASGIGAGINKGAGAVKGLLGKAGQNADELRVLTTAGATGGSIAKPKVLEEAARVPGGVSEMARVLRESGISKGVTTTSGIAKRAGAAMDSSGAKIGAMIDDATNAGGFVDTAKLAAGLRAEAANATKGMGGVSDVASQHARALERMAQKIEAAAPGGVAPVDQIKAMSVSLSDDAQQAYRAAATGRPVAGQGKALMDTRRITERGIDESMDNLGMSSQAYKDARRLNQVSRIASESAETSLGRAGKNNLIGLTTATLAQTSPVLAALRGIAGPITASSRATAAEMAQRIASNPNVLKGLSPEAAQQLQAGAAAGGPALIAAVKDSMDEIDALLSAER